MRMRGLVPAIGLAAFAACSFENGNLGAGLVDGRVSVVARPCDGVNAISKVVVYVADEDATFYDRDIAVFRLNPMRRHGLTVPIDGKSEAYDAETRSEMIPSSVYAAEVIDQDGGWIGEVTFRPQDLKEGFVTPGVGADAERMSKWDSPADCYEDEVGTAIGSVMAILLLIGLVGSGTVIIRDARRRRRQRRRPVPNPIPPPP